MPGEGLDDVVPEEVSIGREMQLIFAEETLIDHERELVGCDE